MYMVRSFLSIIVGRKAHLLILYKSFMIASLPLKQSCDSASVSGPSLKNMGKYFFWIMTNNMTIINWENTWNIAYRLFSSNS